ATTVLYTLSLHDALPISTREASVSARHEASRDVRRRVGIGFLCAVGVSTNFARALFVAANGLSGPFCLPPHQTPTSPAERARFRSEEHTSELQSRENLVC